MKLVEILAKHVKAWPKNADCAMQSRGDGTVMFFPRTEENEAHDFNPGLMAEDPGVEVYENYWSHVVYELHQDARDKQYDQELWDRVALAAFTAGFESRIAMSATTVITGSAVAADLFMEERAKRIQEK